MNLMTWREAISDWRQNQIWNRDRAQNPHWPWRASFYEGEITVVWLDAKTRNQCGFVIHGWVGT